MRRAGIAGILAVSLTVSASGCEARAEGEAAAARDSAVAAVDDLGRVVRLPRSARRVISLLPAGTEMLFALGAGARVVGRTRYDQDPAVAHLPSVGGGLDPSLETLVSLRPDLVLAWESPTGSPVRERLEALGIPVFALSTRDTAAIFRALDGLGRLVGREAAADSLLRGIRAELDAVRASVPPGPRPSVLYVIDVDPPIIAGTDNFISELIGVAGGRPVQVSGERRGLSPQVSLEELLRRQPDVVMLPVGIPGTTRAERLRREPGWRELRAVREGRVAEIPLEVVNRPGPGIGEAARILRAALRAHWEER